MNASPLQITIKARDINIEDLLDAGFKAKLAVKDISRDILALA